MAMGMDNQAMVSKSMPVFLDFIFRPPRFFRKVFDGSNYLTQIALFVNRSAKGATDRSEAAQALEERSCSLD
jgi:hypothetical protein